MKFSLDLNLDSIFRHMMKLTPKEKEQWDEKLPHLIINEASHTISFPYESCEVEDGFWEIECSKIEIFWQHVQLILQSSNEDFYKVFLHRFCIWHNYLQVKHDPMNYFLIIPFTFNALILQAAVKNYSCKFVALKCKSCFKVVVI